MAPSILRIHPADLSIAPVGAYFVLLPLLLTMSKVTFNKSDNLYEITLFYK